MLRIITFFAILGCLMFVSTAEEVCVTRLEKVNCTDVEKSELHYVCESRSSENCSCIFPNPIRSEIGWFKTCRIKNSRNVRKKKVRKRQIVVPAPEIKERTSHIEPYARIITEDLNNLCGTIAPPRPGKVSCSVSSTEIKCIGTCGLDYEFIDGTQEKTYFCLYADGVWIPAADFPPCKPKCNPQCENGGTCQSVNFCACSNDFRGNFCQYPITLCSISKNKFASTWQCNHTRSETNCDVSCHPPDTPEAELDVSRYRCTIDGIWDPQLPQCVQVLECEEPKTIKNGRWQLAVGHILSPGSRIVYNCEDGYFLQGEKFSECSRNGTWTNEFPACIRQQKFNVCEDPGETPYGWRNISSAGFFEGSYIGYECLENFTLLGNAILMCMSNGHWSSAKPQCVPRENAPAFCSKPNAPKNSLVHVTFPDQHPLATIFNKDIPVSQWLYIINFARGQSGQFAALPDKTFVVGTRVQYKCKSRLYKLYGSEYQTCQSSRIWSGYQPACVPECGKSDSPKTPFIVNGNSSRIGQWPWQVGLVVKTRSGLHLLCGGVLVSELWVLTAAHCAAKKLSNVPTDTKDLLVFCGKYYRNFDKDDEYVQVKQVQKIIIHEDYDFIHFDGDIALLQLESAVELTTRVQPICLPTEDTTRENMRDGKRGMAIGWGLTENGKFSETLKETVLPVVSHDRCEEAYREGLRTITITKNMFCAGHESGQSDTCSGDSGGPLMFAVGPANDNRWYLEGITSWGSESGCGKSHRYSGFTKVGRFVPWINMYI